MLVGRRSETMPPSGGIAVFAAKFSTTAVDALR